MHENCVKGANKREKGKQTWNETERINRNYFWNLKSYLSANQLHVEHQLITDKLYAICLKYLQTLHFKVSCLCAGTLRIIISWTSYFASRDKKVVSVQFVLISDLIVHCIFLILINPKCPQGNLEFRIICPLGKPIHLIKYIRITVQIKMLSYTQLKISCVIIFLKQSAYKPNDYFYI